MYGDVGHDVTPYGRYKCMECVVGDMNEMKLKVGDTKDRPV